MHELRKQFSTLFRSKMEIFLFFFFFHILTFHNDEISYVKHVLDPLNVFFTLFGCFFLGGGGGGGLPRGLGHNLLMQSFILYRSKMEISETDFSYYSDHSK